MKYVPKKLSENHNVSKTRPEIDFIQLIAGLILALFVLYFAVGLIGFLTIKIWPTKADQLMAKIFTIEQEPKYKKQQQKLQSLLDLMLTRHSKELHTLNIKPKVIVMNCPAPNAFAAPGGLIAFCNQLIKEIKSENELAMVLGHELAHLTNKDHITSLGAGVFLLLGNLVIYYLTDVEFDLFSLGGKLIMLSHSRYKESQADQFALQALMSVYGHVGGAKDLFTTFAKIEKKHKGNSNRAANIFETHPLTSDRYQALDDLIKSNNYPELGVTALKF